MALRELRGRLSRCFEQMRSKTILDETILNSCLNEITGALLDAGFPGVLLNKMERKIQEIIKLPAPSNKGRRIYQILFAELSSMLDPGKSALIQGKTEPSIVMFVGLRGVEKTNVCAKYARYHLKKGFRPALVCADTFEASALFDSKEAAKDDFPVYESYTTDPGKLASEGIAKFMEEKRDLIIVDTSGRHKEYSAMFEEMHQLTKAVKPDLVIFVMDSRIGQIAFDQAQAFKQSFTVGVVILTNINNSSKPGGTLSGLAVAKCPMILAEAGEKSGEFEAFEAEPFVKNLLENPWFSPADGQQTRERTYTLRDMYTYYRTELGLENMIFHIPRHASEPQPDLERMKHYVKIMDSMTDEELDRSDVKQISQERVMEIAKGSKVDAKDVMEMLKTYKRKAKGFMNLEERLRNAPNTPYKLCFSDI